MYVTNWDTYQHYKSRGNMVWVKLYTDILSSRAWVLADEPTRALMIVCLCVAARNDGEVPDEPEYLKRVGSLSFTPRLDVLVKLGFLSPLPVDVQATLANGQYPIPLKDGSLHQMTAEDIAKYVSTFVNIDVHAELKAIALWNEANPAKRKTAGGIRRHIHTWLSRANERAKPADTVSDKIGVIEL